MNLRIFSLVLLLAACATEPPGPTAPAGTFEWAQQKYMEELQKCQQAHPWQENVDAGLGAVTTSADAAFGACLKQPKADLAKAVNETPGQS